MMMRMRSIVVEPLLCGTRVMSALDLRMVVNTRKTKDERMQRKARVKRSK